METTLKLLTVLSKDTDPTEEDWAAPLAVQIAHIRLLQEDYQTILVKGQFDDNIANICRTLQKTTSSFSSEIS